MHGGPLAFQLRRSRAPSKGVCFQRSSGGSQLKKMREGEKRNQVRQLKKKRNTCLLKRKKRKKKRMFQECGFSLFALFLSRSDSKGPICYHLYLFILFFSKISTAKSGMFLALCLQPAKLPVDMHPSVINSSYTSLSAASISLFQQILHTCGSATDSIEQPRLRFPTAEHVLTHTRVHTQQVIPISI